MKTTLLRVRVARALAITFLASVVQIAGIAQAFPDHPIELVVPFAPGGSTDAMARLVAPRLSEEMKVPVVVLNRPGAGGAIGTTYALATHDGYRISTGGNSNLGPLLVVGENVNYKIDDIAGLGLGTTNTLAIVSKPGRFADFAAFVQEARGGKQLSVASWGIKTPAHFYIALLGQQLSSRFLHVPFDGGSKAMVAAIGGQVDAAVVTLTTALASAKAGQLTILAITSGERSHEMLGVPTVKEAGYPGLEYVSFDGFVASAKIPAERLEALRSAMRKVLNEPGYRESMRKIGSDPAYLDGKAYDDYLRANLRKLTEIAARTPIGD